MGRNTPVPVDHPGTFIKEELEARNWSQSDLAYILGMDATQLNKLIKGGTDITTDSAIALGDAFGMPAEFFLNLQNMYNLHKKAKKADSGVKVRATWLSAFPVREMIKRKWIESAEADLLDLQMMRFFEKNRIEDIPFVGDAPILAHAARKSSYESTTPIQYAWLYRVRKIGESINFPKYSESALRNSLKSIRAHMLDENDLIKIPYILKECGVRFVLVESLPGAKIDGVCVWIDDQPVIGMTLRLDRLDNFCFVLRHEIEHILRGDGKEETFSPVDEFTTGECDDDDRPECERIADEAAGEFCVPRDLLHSFVARKSPFISERDVLNFASRVEIHPTIVVGQIQKYAQKWGWLRKYQTSIRPHFMDWPYKDGWDYFYPTGL